jgi:chloride channel 3/4/5
LTALVAFFIIRSEQWFFDLKEGRCIENWWRAKRFCEDWQTWTEAFGRDGPEDNGSLPGYWLWNVEYAVYAAIAVSPLKR